MKPRALTYTQMMNGAASRSMTPSTPASKSCSSASKTWRGTLLSWSRPWRIRALTSFLWIKLCISCAQARGVLNEVLCSPHSSDDAADAFLVADPVVLEAQWSGGEFGRSHVLYPFLSNK